MQVCSGRTGLMLEMLSDKTCMLKPALNDMLDEIEKRQIDVYVLHLPNLHRHFHKADTLKM